MRQTILFISCDEIPGHVKKGSQITLGHFHGQMFWEKTCSSPIQGPGQESSFRVTSLVGRFNIRFPLYWSQGFSFMSESQKTSPIHFHPQPCLLPSPSLTGMGQCQQRRWSCQGQHAPWLFISLSVDTSNNISYFLVSSAGLWYNPALAAVFDQEDYQVILSSAQESQWPSTRAYLGMSLPFCFKPFKDSPLLGLSSLEGVH